MRFYSFSIVVVLTIVGLGGCAGTEQQAGMQQEQGHVSHAMPVTAAKAQTTQQYGAPLFTDLGKYHCEITTNNPTAQRYFDQGLTLAYAFNHAEAVRSFEEAARQDPDCAMAHWGVALALGPNINAPMTKDVHAKAIAALAKAQRAAKNATAKERDVIAALATRYGPEWVEDRSAQDKAYAEAMQSLADKYPDDLDIQTLMAESIMDTSPWNYWTPDLKPQPGTDRVVAALESVLERNPDHPGANHLYIHAMEAGPAPHKALAAADRLRDLVPGAGHLVHMPSHIYLRVGKYAEASWSNEQAIHADESYFTQCAAQGFYPAMYYPHNVHFLWYTAAMEGRSAASMEAANKAAAHQQSLGCGAPEGPRQRPLPMLAALRFGKWDDVLAAPKPADMHAFDVATWHYARGVAHVQKNQLDEAASELSLLRQVAGSEEAKKFDTQYLPATQVLTAMAHELAGELAIKQGKAEEGLAELRKGVEVEDQLPYMEPPFYHYPIRHTLGAALLATNRSADAEAIYREDLNRHPSNGWALFGLMQSLKAQDKTAQAAEVQREFEQAWMRSDVELTSSRF